MKRWLKLIRDNKAAVIIMFIIFLLLIAPIFAYTYRFHFGIWSTHDDWSKMGSALGGIYSPIIALLTLAVLIRQWEQQAKADKHTADTTYIHDSVSNFQYYLSELEKELQKPANQALGSMSVQDAIVDAVSNEQRYKYSRAVIDITPTILNDYHRKVLDLWGATIPILDGLNKPKETFYETSYYGCKLKAMAILSNEVCVALDLILSEQISKSENKYKFNFHFKDG